MPAVLEGVYELPRSLSVEPAVLGREWDVLVGGVAGTCSLPTLDPDPPEAFEMLLPPPRARAVREGVMWGQPFLWPDRLSVLNAVYLSFPVEHLDANDQVAQIEVAGAVERAIDAWFRRLCDWMEAYTGQDLDVREPFRSGREHGRGLLLECADENGRWHIVSPQTLVLYSGSKDHSCSLSAWEWSLRNANDQMDLPEARRFIVLAQRAKRRKQRRRAVLDAATAAELAMAEGLTARLAHVEGVVADELLATARELGRRSRLCRRLGLAVPSDIQDGLVEPRNRATHEGYEPTVDETERALAIATQIVDALLPLPGP